MKHDIEWVTAPPLWDLAQVDAGARTRFRQPALLRFDSDSFMEELIEVLEKRSTELADRVAKPETWETPAAGWVAAADPSLGKTLNLFQPVHGRFYLGAASLVCRRVGLPMRAVKAADGDRTSMLMRRLVPAAGMLINPADPGTFIEQPGSAIARPASGPPYRARRWSAAKNGCRCFRSARRSRADARVVWAGMLPVASREIYESARPAGATPRPLQPAPP